MLLCLSSLEDDDPVFSLTMSNKVVDRAIKVSSKMNGKAIQRWMADLLYKTSYRPDREGIGGKSRT